MTVDVKDLEAPVRTYAHLLLQLDRLMSAGNSETEEADAIRSKMDEPWYALTELEQERLRNLSADLYVLAEGGPQGRCMSVAERLEYERQWQAAVAAEDWDRCLGMVRQPPDDITLSELASRQATAWTKLGDPEVAQVFARQAERLEGSSDWSSNDSMVKLARATFSADAEHFFSLLESSKRLLDPFPDPLEVDFGAHRWLAAEREEAYSDWLAWIVLQLQTPEEVFPLFNIDPPPGAQEWKTRTLKLHREEWVPQGHLGHTGRLDLVIRYGESALLVIEIKTCAAEVSDLMKQKGYQAWVERQTVDWKDSVLLAVSGKDSEYAGKFRFVSWADVCINLRRTVPKLRDNGKAIAAAMILAFVGAVEQNLLGFSAEEAKQVSAGHIVVGFNARVVDHLARFCGQERSVIKPNGEESTLRNSELELIKSGVMRYLPALTALSEFERVVQTSCRRVVEKMLDQHAADLAIPKELIQVDDWTSRDGSGKWALVGVKMKMTEYPPMYYYLFMHQRSQEDGVYAEMWLPNHKLAVALEGWFRVQDPIRTGRVDNTVWYGENLADASSFDYKLSTVISGWLQLWKNAGGLNCLTQISLPNEPETIA